MVPCPLGDAPIIPQPRFLCELTGVPCAARAEAAPGHCDFHGEAGTLNPLPGTRFWLVIIKGLERHRLLAIIQHEESPEPRFSHFQQLLRCGS